MRKRAASPADPVEPLPKKARQGQQNLHQHNRGRRHSPIASAEPSQSDAASNNSRAASDKSSTAGDADTADTPPTPVPFNVIKPKPNRRSIYHCTVDGCERSFNRPCRLEEHIRSHNNERPFSCTQPDCTKTFIRQTHLNRHVKDEHDNVREHECNWPGCDKKFANATRLKRHIEAHESKFHCADYPPCQEVFRKHSTLQKHIRSAHLGQKKYQCTHVDPDTGEQCDQAYDSPASLKAHEGRVHGGIQHFCTQCALDPEAPYDTAPGFATYTALQTHVKEVHPPTCDFCNLRCSSYKQLTAHVELAHSGLTLAERKKFPCPYTGCRSTFTKNGNLNVHIRHTHEMADKFICGEMDLNASKKDHIRAWDGEGACGRGFSSKGNLEEHIQTQHLGMDGTRKLKEKEKLIQEGKDPNAPVPKKSRSREAKVPMATRLTGFDYDNATGRNITCLFDTECENRFYREYDLQIHLEAVHGMSGTEALEAMKERAASEGGNFWIGGLDEVMGGEPVVGGGYMGAQYEWDEEDWEAQQELDRRAGIRNVGPPVNVHSAGPGGAEPQHGEVYNAVWNYLQDQE